MSGVSFDDLGDFGWIGTRLWLTSNYFVDGVEHDSHTFVISSRGDYCERTAAFRAARTPAADAYWGWVGRNVGWDAEQGRAAPDDAVRTEWLDRSRSYLAEASELWQDEFEESGNVVYVQFHRGTQYAAGDRAEHDSPLPPAADGEGEVAVGGHPVSAEPGAWRWNAAVGLGAGNPYVATADSLADTTPEAFEGLSTAWDPEAVGEWFRATGGTASMSRDSVHSWDLDLTDGTLVDADGDDAGGFRMWGNYYRCFVDYVDMEPPGAGE